MQFAELYLLCGAEVPSGPDHDEEGRSVTLDFRALMSEDRIFDREFVQAELASERRELLDGGAVEADSGHGAEAGLERRIGVAERCGRLDAASVLIDRVVDQAERTRPGSAVSTLVRAGAFAAATTTCERACENPGHAQNGSPDG